MRIDEKTVRDALDKRFSGLTASPALAARIRQRIAQEEEPKMKKKLSLTLGLVLALLLAAASAVAAGIVFSRRADAALLADQALEKAYGVTSAMQGGYFTKTVEEKADGETVVTYAGMEALRYVLGEYTVTLKNGNAAVKWSRDGEPTSGGFDSDAWGAEQLAAMMAWDNAHHDVSGYWNKAVEIAGRHGAETSFAGPSPTQAEIEALAAQYAADEAAARAAAKLSEEDMISRAAQAVAAAYGLTPEQAARMTCPQDIEEYYYYNFRDGKPVYSVWFYLTQRPSDDPEVFPEFTEKDGIYVVDVNVETGVIEHTLYDPPLGGNG